MPQFHIDEVVPKDTVYPMVVNFQNGYVTEKFKTNECLLLEDEKSGKKTVATELCDLIYSGEEEQEDLGRTLILARNSKTGKVRLLETENIELKPLMKCNLDTTEVNDTSYLELSRKFGSKKHKQIMEHREKLKVNVQTVTEQMQNVTDSITEDQLDLSSYNKTDSDEFYIPAINREATKVEEVYDVDTILTPEQCDKIYSEIEGTKYMSELNPFLKSLATKELSKQHTVFLVYAQALLQLYATLMKDISKKTFTACPYSVTLNEIVLNNFLSNINGHTKSKVWQDSTIKSSKEAHRAGLSTGLKNPTGKGKRLIIGHIGSTDGFLMDGELIFEAKKGDGDYHSEMDAHNFEKWFKLILTKIESDAVIVMDNAPYHSRKVEKLPTTATRKADIQEWLKTKNIHFDEKDLRATLLEKVKQVRHLYQKFAVDEMAKEKDILVLRLPPYHCELNPIELVWAQMKGYVAQNNKTFKLKEVKRLLPQALINITAEKWQSCIAHTIKEEERFCQLDGIMDNVVERFIINVGETSSSSSSSEDDE